MKVLMISLDRNLFKSHAPAQQRIAEYGALADELHIIVFAKRGVEARRKFQIAQNVWVYPTCSFSRWLYICDAFRIGRRIIDEAWLVSCQDPFEVGLVGWLLKLTRKARLQLQVHIDFYSPYFKRETWENRVRFYLGRFLLKKADGIRVVSNGIKKYLVEEMHIPGVHVAVLPVFTDTKHIAEVVPEFDLHERYPRFETILVMISRLVKQKNISLALGAVRKLVRQFPKIGLVIVGSGPEKERLRAEVARLGIKGYVVFEPWAEDVVSYYKTADIFLLTSNYEGYVRTPVEALAAGCPVIMTDVGCAWDIVLNEANGYIVPIGDVSAVAEAIAKARGGNIVRGIPRFVETKQDYLRAYKHTWEMCMLS